MIREPLRDRVKGRWHGVLPQLGVPAQFLNRKHQPCPLCGGTDRARFDDKDGNGTWICSHCGAGDGIALVMKLHGWDYKRAAEEIEKVSGLVEPEASRPAPDPGKQIGAMRRVWNEARPIGETVRRYLVSRGLRVQDLRDLRQAGTDMLALVRGSDGKGGQVHRTRLTLRRASRPRCPPRCCSRCRAGLRSMRASCGPGSLLERSSACWCSRTTIQISRASGPPTSLQTGSRRKSRSP
jgi:putative DNA primase/helicase